MNFDYYVQCDISGHRVLASETRRTWDGKIVWYKYYEERHPQDIPPEPKPDRITPPFTRPITYKDGTPAESYTSNGGIIPTDYISEIMGVNQSGLEFENVEVPYNQIPSSFYPPDQNIYYWTDTLKAKYIRVPFAVERMFSSVTSNVNTNFVARINTILQKILDKGKIPIIDMHCFGKFRVGGVNKRLGSADFTVANWVEMWRKLAIEFSYDNRIELDLCNEPDLTDLDSEQWRDANNLAIAAIRGEGVNNCIHIELQAATGVPYIFNLNRAKLLEGIVDPANNWILQTHLYTDKDYNGGGDLSTNSDCDAFRFFQRVTEYVYDFRRRTGYNLQVHLGELGGGNNPLGHLALQNIVQYMYKHKNIWRSCTIWGGGAAWGATYELKTDPAFNGNLTTSPVVQTLQKQLPYIGNKYDSKMFFDFRNQVYSAPLADNFTCTRNTTTSYAQNQKGEWLPFSANKLRITDRGLLVEDRAENLIARDWYDTATTVNTTVATGKSDFLGGTNGLWLTESGTGDVVHRASKSATGLMTVGQPYVFQFLYDFPENMWIYTGIGPTANFGTNPRLSNVYNGDYWTRSGQWKAHHCRGTINETFSTTYRCQIGFQPDDTLTTGYDTPDSYERGSNERHISICCPMLCLGDKVQSPIFSASANAVREADDISIVGNALNLMKTNPFVIVLEIASNINESNAVLLEPVSDTPFLMINNTVALRKNTDGSLGSDFVSTQTTAIPFNGRSAWRANRKVALVVGSGSSTGNVRIWFEGETIVGINGNVPAINSIKLGKCHEYIENIRIYKGNFSDSQIQEICERY